MHGIMMREHKHAFATHTVHSNFNWIRWRWGIFKVYKLNMFIQTTGSYMCCGYYVYVLELYANDVWNIYHILYWLWDHKRFGWLFNNRTHAPTHLCVYIMFIRDYITIWKYVANSYKSTYETKRKLFGFYIWPGGLLMFSDYSVVSLYVRECRDANSPSNTKLSYMYTMEKGCE